MRASGRPQCKKSMTRSWATVRGLTKLQKKRKSVGWKWVFCTKNDALDEIVRYVAWLITNKYSYMAIVDFNEIFYSVAKFIIIRCDLALRDVMDWKIHQMDVKTTFLKVEIYID